MVDEKGKGRAHPREVGGQTHPDEPSQAQASSLVSRVTASVIGLSRNSFAAPNGNELDDSVATALASAEKGQSSRSGEGTAWAESSRVRQSRNQVGGSNAFKVGQNEQNVRESEDEFSSFLDGIDSLSPDPSNIIGSSNPGYGALGNDLEDAWTRTRATAMLQPSSKAQYRSIAEQEQLDGEDVLAILSGPSDANASYEASEEDEDNYDWDLSPEQLSQLREMTKDLFPAPEPHASIPAAHPLNLVPSFGETNANGHGQREAAPAEESYPYLGPHDDAAAQREFWMSQWDGVLTQYTDEVWGGLLQLVKDARKEVKAIRNESTGADQPKALRRLRAILGHLQKR